MSTEYLSEALQLAREGQGRVSPNPAVGAIIVKDGAVVGRGFHTWAGVKHAEVLALEQAGGQARGATLYVTLEPCSHHGRTGPCIEALAAAGIRKVVAITEDPNPVVAGSGFRLLRDAGIEVELDATLAAEAEELNLAFFHYMRNGSPLVMLKSAMTLDGKIAAPDDNSGWITSERARAHVQQVRHLHDAILTGIGTVLADNCRLTDRSNLERSRPLLRIVMDSLLRLPVGSEMVESCNHDILAVCTSIAPPFRREALEKKGVEILVADGTGGRPSFRRLVEVLAERRYLSLMIEAGSKINWGALESGIVDRILFYYAPKILGGTQSIPVAGGIGRRHRADAMRFTRTKLHVIPPDEYAVEAWYKKA